MGFFQEKTEDTIFLTIPAFSATGLVRHGYTTRLGGFSQGSYQTMNLGFHVGDLPDAVLANRKRIAGLFGASLDQMVAANQVHGCHVHRVTADDIGRGSRDIVSAIPETDALVTDQAGILLSTFYADCVSLFFLDPGRKAIGLAHAGWKGTCQKIGGETLRVMAAEFGTDPADCLVGIGPAIGPCCFQVNEDVYQEFKKVFDFNQQICLPDGPGKWRIDLWQANRLALIAAGVKAENITMSNLCTSCHPELFFSHRQEAQHTGRQGAFMMICEGRP